MKVRNGFVSNSSSSSFLILIKDTDTDPCKHCGRSSFNVLSLIGADGDYSENSIDARGRDAILAHYLEEYDYEETDEYFEKIRKKLDAAEGKGEPVLLSLDTNNELFFNIIHREEKAGSLEILDNDGC